VAFVGYLVFNAPSPLFWGVLTCFATIIPIFGTALVWLPLAGYMALTGDWGPAIGLLLYGGLVVTHVDNVVRFIMQKKMADTHPLVTIFGVFIGLSLFGFMGVIFGPLMLGDIRLLRQYLQEEIPRRDVVQAVVRARARYPGVARRGASGRGAFTKSNRFG